MTSYFKPGLLNGRTALVTGGGTGICRGIAHGLAKAACDVAITSRKQEHLDATRQLLGTMGQSHASAAKAGVDALTRALAAEWGPHGIRVNGLAPGPVEDTEGVRRLTTPASRARINEQCPLGRLATIDEV